MNRKWLSAVIVIFVLSISTIGWGLDAIVEKKTFAK